MPTISRSLTGLGWDHPADLSNRSVVAAAQPICRQRIPEIAALWELRDDDARHPCCVRRARFTNLKKTVPRSLDHDRLTANLPAHGIFQALNILYGKNSAIFRWSVCQIRIPLFCRSDAARLPNQGGMPAMLKSDNSPTPLVEVCASPVSRLRQTKTPRLIPLLITRRMSSKIDPGFRILTALFELEALPTTASGARLGFFAWDHNPVTCIGISYCPHRECCVYHASRLGGGRFPVQNESMVPGSRLATRKVEVALISLKNYGDQLQGSNVSFMPDLSCNFRGYFTTFRTSGFANVSDPNAISL